MLPKNAKDLTGQRFGRLVAVEPVGSRPGKGMVWRFQCDCGQEKIMPAANVRWGKVRSSGCLHAEHIRQLNRQDIAGRRYGRLLAVRPTDRHDVSGSIVWECRCDCGQTVYHSVNQLSKGGTRSCGCLYRESRSTASENRRDAVGGTLVSALVSSQEPHTNNTSGCTGVYFDKRTEKWQSYINFRKKRYCLGFFKEKQKAIEARKAAEKKLYEPVILEQWDSLTEQTKRKYLEYQAADSEG